MSSIAVSVVIPNYNRGHLIRAAVESALSSGDVAVEVLVCDDGSTDDSESVVRGVADPRVRWLPGARSGGPAVPRNRGVREAKGEWVAFLDSDDTWLPGKLDAQLRELRRTGDRACSTNAFRCVPGQSGSAALLYDSLPSTITLADQLSTNFVITSSMVALTSDLRRVGGFPETSSLQVYEDYALWLRLAQLGPIRALPTPYVHYRDDVATSIRGGMALELRCTFNALRDFTAWRRAQDPAIRATWRERTTMARQVAGLVSVRAVVARTVRSRQWRMSSA
ncbi:glycosyltransferase family 2 protein [Nocardioides iriomotensis]|uniref:glycosyltransferase family 2 protein n=1 Tax=Nocardioides iriomotensis TaxID=715784 RepID=UPI0013EDD26A|nr:glycosyltransferase family A protein [Nocardioides iriomotensis]